MQTLLRPLILSIAAALAIAAVPTTHAAVVQPKPEDAAGEKAETAKPKRDWYPFYGTVASVDRQAKTVSLKKKEGERVLKLDAKSEIQVNGKPGGLGDVKVGDYAHGKVRKDAGGKEVLVAAKFDKEGPRQEKDKPAGEKPSEPKAPAKPKN
ncbi:MAG: hypothetical protein HYR88_08785 [Verrucomicrobia bacterium]|nr:hypothetical protein [Verrucomicrobiota bacterium]MBI3870227.1 hypothetical protein [Verrucomicrobiota bacterium]